MRNCKMSDVSAATLFLTHLEITDIVLIWAALIEMLDSDMAQTH